MYKFDQDINIKHTIKRLQNSMKAQEGTGERVQVGAKGRSKDMRWCKGQE